MYVVLKITNSSFQFLLIFPTAGDATLVFIEITVWFAFRHLTMDLLFSRYQILAGYDSGSCRASSS